MLIMLAVFISCKKDTKTTETPGRDNKSAGNSTTYTFTSVAFDTPSPWVTGDMESRFLSGDNIYDTPRNSGTVISGGLGDLYNGYTCAGCHDGGGRTPTTLHTEGGTGHHGFSVFLVDFQSDDPKFIADYGTVLHDQAIVGHTPEGTLEVSYEEKTYQFPDGEEYKLLYPTYTVKNWWTGDVGPYEQSVRTPLKHVGMGMMMALDREQIKELATKDYSEYGISGKVNYVNGEVGLVGHKAQNTDLTVELSFASDMGVMNSRFPKASEIFNSHASSEDNIEVSDEDMADVDFYLHTLGVAARRNVNDPQVIRGEKMFSQAKCDLCHVKTLKTRPEGATLIDGTHLPQLGNQVIHPFSDYLVHDMGDELGDNVSHYLATGNEWRTTPLWGLGLQKVVNGHMYMMHDSRARNYVEAIMWHGGEGEYSRNAFKNMPKSDRDALVAYLYSL